MYVAFKMLNVCVIGSCHGYEKYACNFVYDCGFKSKHDIVAMTIRI